jgi:hypothetical protein
MVSHCMPAAGTNDALTPLERSGIPLLREKNGFVRKLSASVNADEVEKR